ncbi:ABC transporter ATP-binding protein [Chryseobacterium sp. MFBS3-17]|uniref:ABC transporter ATP-binding protein n=1 Tax=Chryseobacterium sp. MFBS3-17 TaxID=2886689 RepID=UPI001D0E12B2|nr:ABC transporter ATP-binding protein [Chryseobacterium sp. MFBS3-17]MCC2589432.1 ABC transporter ATP-binding protein/permease [Chryseobacterium sp. MFBS3-17]
MSIIGYFKYFQSFTGYRSYVYIFLNFLVGLFDSLGLAMFIPLIALVVDSPIENESMGKLQFLVDSISDMGWELNLKVVLFFMIGLFCVKALFYYIKANYLNETLLIAQTKIRYQLVNGLSEISYEGFTKMNAGKTQNNLVAETGKFMGAMNSYFTSIQNTVMLLTYLIMATISNWKFSIMVAIGALLTNFLYKFINKKTKEIARNISNIGHDYNGKIIQTVANFKYLKATNKLEIFKEKLKSDILTSEKMNYRITRISSIGESLREPLVIGIIALVLYIQLEFVKSDFGSILVSLLLFYKSLGFLITLQATWNSFLKSSAGIESIESLLIEFRANRENKSDIFHEKIGNLKVENLCITFGNRPILKNINLTIPEKISIAFVGQSGAGKTTLANVICGLQIPHSGNLINENTSVYHSNLNSYRKNVGYITQEPVIFDDTLFNNITLWDQKTPENLEKFKKAMKQVDLMKFYQILEFGEDTQLGNNGVLISGGQKQRVSIARELYKECQLLIMDEATSALDSETEKNIKDSIDILQGKFTILIIAHRISTIKNVDKIYLLNEGEIEDSGSYEELCQNSLKFKKMVELQEL